MNGEKRTLKDDSCQGCLYLSGMEVNIIGKPKMRGNACTSPENDASHKSPLPLADDPVPIKKKCWTSAGNKGSRSEAVVLNIPIDTFLKQITDTFHEIAYSIREQCANKADQMGHLKVAEAIRALPIRIETESNQEGGDEKCQSRHA